MAGFAGRPFHRLARLSALGAAWVAALGAQPQTATEPSRDARSAAYCSQRANTSGQYDTDAALACRREEYTAAARARALDIPPELDEYCESLAAEGDAIGPFSWRAYVDCIDAVLP